MNILLFFSGIGSLSDIFYSGFKEFSNNVKIVNYLSFISEFRLRLDNYFTRLPFRYRYYLRSRYLSQINKKYLEVIQVEKPDLVLIYNDQMVTADMVKVMKKAGAKVAVFLADSPFFLNNRDHLFRMLFEVDHIFVPDTYWLEQLYTIGLIHTTFLIPGSDRTKYYPKTTTEQEKKLYGHDLFYLGSTYANIWGYKRALFLSKFCKLDIVFYGPPAWKRWFKEFPELECKYYKKDSWLNNNIVNTILNCCKLHPVDGNPGVINGLHIRIFDCIGSGILPIVEYRKDLKLVFGDVALPVIKNYDEAAEIAAEYLNDDVKRSSTIINLQKHINTHFRPDQAASLILKILFN